MAGLLPSEDALNTQRFEVNIKASEISPDSQNDITTELNTPSELKTLKQVIEIIKTEEKGSVTTI
jgi:hypothetical protein